MRIKWQNYDDQVRFEEVLAKIRSEQLTNVVVSFTDNVGQAPLQSGSGCRRQGRYEGAGVLLTPLLTNGE